MTIEVEDGSVPETKKETPKQSTDAIPAKHIESSKMDAGPGN
jgi:hypothetical protein